MELFLVLGTVTHMYDKTSLNTNIYKSLGEKMVYPDIVNILHLLLFFFLFQGQDILQVHFLEDLQ